MTPDMSEDILSKYILREATEEERSAVEAWVKADARNAEKLKQLEIILNAGQRLAQQSPLTEAEAWAKFKELRNAKQKAKGNVRTITALRSYQWLQIAAALLVIMGGGWLSYNFYKDHRSSSEQWSSLTATTAVRVDTLPDGSVVHLNKNSSIAYAPDFSSNRTIRISGEAFFEVKHDENFPFTVQTKEILIKDIGTAFNVKSVTGHTEVIVESGIVSISKEKALVNLKARERVMVYKGDKTLRVEESKDQLYNYYRTNKFVANNTPLRRLVAAINEAYGSNIQISSNVLANTPITVTLKLETPLQDVLQVLKETTPEIKIDKSANGIVLHH
jgi:transmembrane sensor